MNSRKMVIVMLLLFGLLIVACGVNPNSESMMDEQSTPMNDETMGEPMEEMNDKGITDEDMMESSASESVMDSEHEDSIMNESESGEMNNGSQMSEMPVDDSGMATEPVTEMMEDESTLDPMMDNQSEKMEAPEWFGIALTDVNNDESFTIQDLYGKVILVEPMAIWCSSCLQQQREVVELRNLLGERDDFVSLSIDIDPNENAADLETYSLQYNFTWRFVIAPEAVARDLAELYGDQFLNPPSTPMLIVDRDGNVHILPFGIKNAEELQEALEPFLNQDM